MQSAGHPAAQVRVQKFYRESPELRVKPDVVVSAAGCRIDEHLEQSSAQASSEPVIPVRPEVAPRGYVDRYITLSDW